MTAPIRVPDVLTGRAFGVKEHVGLFKAANQFDVMNSAGAVVMQCREPNLGFFTKLLRFTDYKKNTPFNCEVRDTAGNLVLRVSRGVSFLFSTVRVSGPDGAVLASFRHRLLSIGGRFTIELPSGQEVGEVRGTWTSFDFAVTFRGRHVAQVTKKWRSLGVEMFTSADQYAVVFDADIADDDPARIVALAAALVVDFILKE
jgi:uncharacterized protein YxjI